MHSPSSPLSVLLPISTQSYCFPQFAGFHCHSRHCIGDMCTPSLGQHSFFSFPSLFLLFSTESPLVLRGVMYVLVFCTSRAFFCFIAEACAPSGVILSCRLRFQSSDQKAWTANCLARIFLKPVRFSSRSSRAPSWKRSRPVMYFLFIPFTSNEEFQATV